MNTAELTGPALDYWCARALVDDDEEIRFAAVDPTIVVTFTHGDLRKLDQRFAPAANWADAADVLERARELLLTTNDAGAARCRIRFAGCAQPQEADGPAPRIALLRAFVRSRFGDTVADDHPHIPHAVRRGVVVPIEAGGGSPTYAEDRQRTGDETSDIRSVPRL